MPEIEIYIQGKKFIAHSKAEVDRILAIFKGWDEKQVRRDKSEN